MFYEQKCVVKYRARLHQEYLLINIVFKRNDRVLTGLSNFHVIDDQLVPDIRYSDHY